MSATLLRIADDVAAQLTDAAGTFSVAFTAGRKWIPRAKLEDLADLRVHVVPKQERGERASKSQWRHEYDVDIGIRKLLTGSEADEETTLDAIATLGEEFIDYWKTHHALSVYSFLDFEQPFAIGEQLVNANRCGASIFTLTFQGWRTNP
jgi:hypothetical protein